MIYLLILSCKVTGPHQISPIGHIGYINGDTTFTTIMALIMPPAGTPTQRITRPPEVPKPNVAVKR